MATSSWLFLNQQRMVGDLPYHQRRVRCYEFAYVVPWDKIVADIGSKTESDR